MKTKIYQTTNHPTGKLKNYLIGYFLSIVITLTAFYSVSNHLLNLSSLKYFLAILAISQFVVQVVFFLHLFNERNPRFRLLVFTLMLSIVLILVIGSLWIMSNLNHNMSLPRQIQYINKRGGGF